MWRYLRGTVSPRELWSRSVFQFSHLQNNGLLLFKYSYTILKNAPWEIQLKTDSVRMDSFVDKDSGMLMSSSL